MGKYNALVSIQMWLIAIGVVVFVLIANNAIRLPVAGFLAVIFATVGWMTTQHLTLYSNRKQHTMNILLQSRLSEVHQKHLDNIRKKFPLTIKMNKEDVQKLKKYDQNKVLDSERYVANYYEFLAAAIIEQDVDEKLLKNCIRGLLCRHYVKMEPYLKDMRGEDDNGEAEFPLRFANYRRLFNEWKNESDDKGWDN